MDTSKTYIKMLLTLPQEFWDGYYKSNESDCMTGWAYVCSCGEVGAVACAHGLTQKDHRQVPYIRQDQLQEMVMVEGISDRVKAVNFSIWIRLLKGASEWSMEQLWLAFVMREKYNKIWNGDEWK